MVSKLIRPVSRSIGIAVVIASAALSGACGKGGREPVRPSYISIAEAETTFGPLISAGNHPTPDQYGTGERMGLFQDANRTVWGLPLIVTSSGELLACAPEGVLDEKATDTFPADSAVVGFTNRPTGWRGGTGDLELLLRDSRGTIRRQEVRGAQASTGSACWAPDSPGPAQVLHYYRLTPK